MPCDVFVGKLRECELINDTIEKIWWRRNIIITLNFETLRDLNRIDVEELSLWSEWWVANIRLVDFIIFKLWWIIIFQNVL